MRDLRQANKGRGLEELVKAAAAHYASSGVPLLLHKVPTEWLPIRDRTGRIISAKVETKAAVDFLGHFRGIPLAADAKQTNGERWPLRNLELHQYEFLSRWEGLAFLFLGFWQAWKFYLLPFEKVREYEVARKQGGPASITMDDAKRWGVEVAAATWLDFLPGLEILYNQYKNAGRGVV